MPEPTPLEQLLADVFTRVRETEDPKEHAKRGPDFLFHMTDCGKDVLGLAEVYAKSQTIDPHEAKKAVTQFFLHALPHLREAGRLLMDEIPDPFTDLDTDSPSLPVLADRLRAGERLDKLVWKLVVEGQYLAGGPKPAVSEADFHPSTNPAHAKIVEDVLDKRSGGKIRILTKENLGVSRPIAWIEWWFSGPEAQGLDGEHSEGDTYEEALCRAAVKVAAKLQTGWYRKAR